MDATKAFDRVNHFKLYSILIKRGVPTFFVNLLISWYSRLVIRVKWSTFFSAPLTVLSGVRQGGILSGHLFNIYVNDILSALRRSDLGCHIRNLFLGALMYADDLLLLSSSITELQKMLDICSFTGKQLGIEFNPSKSKCLVIGPNLNLDPVYLKIGNLDLPWSEKLDYLGITITSGKNFQG